MILILFPLSSKNEILRLAIKYIRILDQVSEFQKKEEMTKEHLENCSCEKSDVSSTGNDRKDGEQKRKSVTSPIFVSNEKNNENGNGNLGSSGFDSPTFNFSNSPDSIFDFSSDSEAEQ